MKQINFIKKSILKHGNKYDYSLVNYINTKTKIKIICPEHGVFEQRPDTHLVSKTPCKICSDNNKKLKNDDFIKIIKRKLGNKYDYSLFEYKDYNTKIKIICPEHGVFEKHPKHLKNGNGCPTCSKIKADNNQRKSIEKLINDFKRTHKNKYIYNLDKINYINTYTPICITCRIHGDFNQIPRDHIRGQGCPYCKESKGERLISNTLTDMNIKFEREKIFNDCLSLKGYPLKYDFYLLEHNIIIEYDGLQHYKTNEYFGGYNGLLERIRNDRIKNEYCIENNIKLIRIKYNEDIDIKLKYLFTIEK